MTQAVAKSANRGGVANRSSTEVATLDPEVQNLINSGAGQEDLVGRDVVAIPFLIVLQPLSPQVNPTDAEYVEGARIGNIFHTVSRECSIARQVIPVVFQRSFLEWVPRDDGGGFRGEHTGPEANELFLSKFNRETGKARLDNGHDLVDTRNYYVLDVAADGTASPALISMSSTQIKASKQWNRMMQDFRPQNINVPPGVPAPLFAAVYNLTTVAQENKKGKWFGWRIARLAETPVELLASAAKFYGQVKGGAVTVDRTTGEDLGRADSNEM